MKCIRCYKPITCYFSQMSHDLLQIKKKLVGFNFWSKQWVICIQPTIFKHSEAGYRILNTAASKRSKATNCRFSLSIYYQQSFFSAAIVVIHLLLDLFQLGYQDISWGLYLDVTDRSISSTYLIIWSSGLLSHYIYFYIKLHSKSFSSYAISLHFVQWKVCAENETYNIPYNRYHSSCRSNCQNFLVWLQDNSASASQHQSETS